MKRTPLLIAIEQALFDGSKPDCEALAHAYGCSVIAVRRVLRDIRERQDMAQLPEILTQRGTAA